MLLGRHGTFTAVVEPGRQTALVGAIVLEDLARGQLSVVRCLESAAGEWPVLRIFAIGCPLAGRDLAGGRRDRRSGR